MKHCVVIIDGAAGWPLPGHNQTSLELAKTPNLDALAREGTIGLARTVPPGMEPSSACACMSVLGYNPAVYYKGRAGIEARSIGIGVGQGEVVFRCNLVAVRDGRMWSYSAGYITTEEAAQLMDSLNERLGNNGVRFYPGVGYRHIVKLADHEETLSAVCTPPHDIPDQPIAGHLPKGKGSQALLDLMKQSESVLRDHPVNLKRRARGEIPATTIWLFWGSGPVPDMPSFQETYGLSAAMTSGVDLLRGLAGMAGMKVLDIKGVTDGPDNNYAGQAQGAIGAFKTRDLVIVHVEAADEAGHAGSIEQKVAAIEKVDAEIISRLRSWRGDKLKLLVMPDHPTPIKVRTHVDDPVPFLMWGPGFKAGPATRFTEAEAAKSGILVGEGYRIMGMFVGKTG